jgi:DNA-binding response OmpR family regulator
MSAAPEKVPAPDRAPERISILLVSAHPEDLSHLRRILHHENWSISVSGCCEDAENHLGKVTPAIVMCERDLPDGNWKRVFRQAQRMEHSPLVLVISRHADEGLWSEVLNVGGYDVLLKPFEATEVTRVIGMAWRHWASTRHAKPASRSAH